MENLLSVGFTKISRKTVAGILLLVFCMLVLTVTGSDMWQVLSLGMFGIMVIICFRDISKNCFFLFFLISLFIFLMSGDIAELLFDKHYYIQFGEEATLHAHKSIFISLSAILAGFIIFPERRKTGKADKNNDEFIVRLRKTAKCFYVVSFILIMISTIDIIRFVAAYGYVAYYSSYSSILPAVLVKVGEYAPLALCVFLATMPQKKESVWVILTFLFYSALTILIGTRSTVVYNVVFILCYCLYRNQKDKGREIWVSKKAIVYMFLCVPFVFSFLYFYDFIRGDREIESISIVDSVVEFFVNIGASSKVIKYGYDYKGQIPQWRFYSLGSTLNYFKYGTLFNLFDTSSIPARHTVKFALESHSFGELISYLVMPQKYLNGEGTGSSYIAELFADFGYAGIAIGSLIYGFVFKRMSDIDNERWLSTTIKLFIFTSMLSAPRAAYDGFIAQILNVNHFLYVFLIYVFARYCRLKSNYVR